jgi:hypothetical protein
MKATSSALAALMLAMTASGAPAQRTQPANTGVSQLAWLAGCWEMTTGNRIIEEQWMAPRAGMMLGQNRTVTGNKAEYELMRIFERGDSLVFAASIPGQPTVEFASSGVTDKRITFANPQHDFPQHVTYWIAASDSLFARIEGTIEGRQRGVDFRFRRAECAPEN